MPQPKGAIPWNKGKSGLQVAWNKGKKLPQVSGKNSPQWKGGRYSQADGYICVYSPNHPRVAKQKRPYVFEHILVAEKKLERNLLPNEIVHHLNGVRDDNRPENLVVMTRAEHMQDHHVAEMRKPWTLRREGQWSRTGFNVCKQCGRNDRRHWGHGYCRPCYKKL